jgi:DNA primase
VIVAEGYFDCIRVHQASLPWVVALMGSSLSMEQERQLLQRFDQIILMLDGDEAGRAASRVISSRLSGKGSVVVVQTPDGAQPDQLEPAAVRRLIDDLGLQV